MRAGKVKALVHQARTTLIAERDAREQPCDEVREQIATARGGALRRGPLRRHLRLCAPCRAYRDAVAAQRRTLARGAAGGAERWAEGGHPRRRDRRRRAQVSAPAAGRQAGRERDRRGWRGRRRRRARRHPQAAAAPTRGEGRRAHPGPDGSPARGRWWPSASGSSARSTCSGSGARASRRASGPPPAERPRRTPQRGGQPARPGARPPRREARGPRRAGHARARQRRQAGQGPQGAAARRARRARRRRSRIPTKPKHATGQPRLGCGGGASRVIHSDEGIPRMSRSLLIALLAALALPGLALAANVKGTSGDDTLTGTPNADRIFGKAGNDKIDGLAGNDRLFGGRGNDTVNGGDGNDGIHGGSGDDTLDGGDGNDRIRGGKDTLNGGAGNDRIRLQGRRHVDGGDGNDRIRAGHGADKVTAAPATTSCGSATTRPTPSTAARARHRVRRQGRHAPAASTRRSAATASREPQPKPTHPRTRRSPTTPRSSGGSARMPAPGPSSPRPASVRAARASRRRRLLTPPCILCIHTRYALPGPRLARRRARARLRDQARAGGALRQRRRAAQHRPGLHEPAAPPARRARRRRGGARGRPRPPRLPPDRRRARARSRSGSAPPAARPGCATTSS